MRSVNKFTIIVPIYHESQDLLDNCFNSIIGQTYFNWECIIVNDGTIFNPPVDSRFRVIDIPHTSVSEARNIGIKETDSESNYLLFVDADDFIDNRYLEIASDIIDQCTPEIVYFEVNNIVSKNNKTAVNYNKITTKKYIGTDACEIGLGYYVGKPISQNMSIAWGKVISVNYLKKNNILFPSNIELGEDNIFSIKCAVHLSKMVYVFNYTPYYRLIRIGSAVDRFFGLKSNDIYFLTIDDVFHERDEQSYLKWRCSIPRMIVENIFLLFMSPLGKEKYKSTFSIRKRLQIEFNNKSYLALLKIRPINGLSKKAILLTYTLSHRMFALAAIIIAFYKATHKSNFSVKP